MTKQERQNKLDIEKWHASQKAGYDLAGAMNWCNYCAYQRKRNCVYGDKPTYKSRVKFPCATAYAKMEKDQDEEIAKKHGVN